MNYSNQQRLGQDFLNLLTTRVSKLHNHLNERYGDDSAAFVYYDPEVKNYLVYIRIQHYRPLMHDMIYTLMDRLKDQSSWDFQEYYSFVKMLLYQRGQYPWENTVM